MHCIAMHTVQIPIIYFNFKENIFFVRILGEMMCPGGVDESGCQMPGEVNYSSRIAYLDMYLVMLFPIHRFLPLG